MSEENGKVCCNCRHNKRCYGNDGMVLRCECEVSGKWLGYVQVMTGWCRRWAKEKDESEVKG